MKVKAPLGLPANAKRSVYPVMKKKEVVKFKIGEKRIVNNNFPVNKKTGKAQPQPVEKVFCPKCGELVLKIYPFSPYRRTTSQPLLPCMKCQTRGN